MLWYLKSNHSHLLFLGIPIHRCGIAFSGRYWGPVEPNRKRKAQQKKSLGKKIGIGFFSFMLLIQLVLIIVIPNTDAYQVAKEFAKTQEELKTELGEIKGFGLLPSGGVAVTKDVNGEKGNATITLLLKGDKAYKSVTFFVFKDYGKDWVVYGMK